MRCDDVRALAGAALDGEATLTEQVAAARHLAGCAACRAWRDDVAAIEARFAAPVGVPDRVLPSLRRPRRLVLGPRGRRTTRLIVLAGALALPAGGAAAALLGDREDRLARPPAAVSKPPAPAPTASRTPAPPARTGGTTAVPPVRASASPARSANPPAGTPSPGPAAKPVAAEVTRGPLVLRLELPSAAQAGAITAMLSVTNTSSEPVSYRTPECSELLIVVDGEAAGPSPQASCGPEFRVVELAPGESRSVTVTTPAAPGPHDVYGVLTDVPEEPDRSRGPLRTPPVRVVVT